MSEHALRAEDFDAFFAAVYANKSPFPWQRRLTAQVCETGAWPNALDLPTGTGKTAVLDIAVFAMAVDAARPPSERTMPRRAILVVDRRTVVDQAHERARTLATLLHNSKPDTLLGRVAAALHSLRGDVARSAPPTDRRPRPLEVAYLRGAIPRDDGWARDPSQPMLGVSTVDQVGSRLLFRGYGVSPGMRSVHAGLLGNDVVYFLDEVHLSQPFAETLAAVQRWRSRAASPPPSKLQVVPMSATHRSAGVEVAFALSDDDHAHPVLQRRLAAKKPATLEVIKVSGDEGRRRGTFAQRLAKLALSSVSERHRRIAVVVNRVQTALAVHDAVAGALRPPDRVVLVTGRMRPLDREGREHELRAVQAGSPRDPASPAMVVIATQCIEAGADLDFDVLITECASLDAVVQRFGRLDRLGDHGEALGVIAIRSDHMGKDDDDAVYGAARTATWSFLSGQPTALDFGLQGEVRRGAPAACLPPECRAPILLPGHLDLWSQTRPAPFPDPDIALWLHGPKQGSPEVNIVWRADLTVGHGSLERLPDDMLESVFAASPPLRQEALAVPLWAAEAWLRGGSVADVADVEGERHDDDDGDDELQARRWAIRWRGGEDGIEILAGPGRDAEVRLRPGDTIIVPSAYGGIRAGTWAPDSQEPVTDRGDEAQLRQRHRLVVRLDALTAAGATEGDVATPTLSALVRRLIDAVGDVSDRDPDDVVEEIRQHLSSSRGAPWLAGVIGGPKLRRLIIEPDSGDVSAHVLLEAVGKVVPGSGLDPADGDEDLTPQVSSDDDGASRTGVAVALADHLAHVEAQAEAFARSRGLPLGLATDVVLAAAWHDAGKADPRFQLWLAGGDEVALASLPAPLAKSALRDNDRMRQREARARAKYPGGARHELASVAMLERAEAVLERAADPDLVLHLIASHHGWCRPFAPIEATAPAVGIEWEHQGIRLSASSDHGLAHVGASVVDRFWKMTQEYGWWGLAWLETLVRLADHRASRDEQDHAFAGGSR